MSFLPSLISVPERGPGFFHESIMAMWIAHDISQRCLQLPDAGESGIAFQGLQKCGYFLRQIVGGFCILKRHSVLSIVSPLDIFPT